MALTPANHTPLTVTNSAEQLAEYLLDQLGSSLRTVVIVRPDDHTIVYLSDELERQYTENTYEQVVDAFRLEHPFFAPEIEGYPIGERRAMVHYHENAFVLQFPVSQTETILVSVTPEVGRDLLFFLEECRERLPRRD